MRGLVISLMVVVCAAWTGNGAAERARDDFTREVILAQNREISAEEAARRAKKKYGGKVLSSRLVDPGDQPPYFRVKLISNGTVRVVRIENRR